MLEKENDVVRIDELDEDEEENKEKANLIQKCNQEQVKRVTARVRGVLKVMNKTYGGSILSEKDFIPSTKAKYDEFIKNMGIDKSKASQYRVFVPFNN
jgi:hypothetical protein